MNELLKFLREHKGSLSYDESKDAFVLTAGECYTAFVGDSTDEEQPDGAVFIYPSILALRRELDS